MWESLPQPKNILNGVIGHFKLPLHVSVSVWPATDWQPVHDGLFIRPAVGGLVQVTLKGLQQVLKIYA